MSEKETGLVERWCVATDEDGISSHATGGFVRFSDYERLQAELEHYQNEHADAVNSLAKSAERNRQYVLEIQGLQTERTALALRVKNLVDAVSWVKLIFTDDTLAQERDPELWLPSVEQALASTDKTAEEVIAEWLGEPVGEVVFFGDPSLKEVSWKKGRMPDIGTKLYAPRTEVKK